MAADGGFALPETTIAEIHAAYRAGALTARGLVQTYLERIEAYDRNGPAINSIVSVNPEALEDAARLDAAFDKDGPVGPLHGIPVIVKDQADVAGMPTTMGSVLFRDHYPGRDCFVASRLRQAGAIFIAKSTLGEMGAGDTHGSLFGSTRNVYDLERTAGGSSGGSGAAVSANLAAVAIGQEGFASIRRPAAWNGIVGMRPTAGLVSRGGVYAGWPMINGSLGPMCRTVADAARLLDAMVGYDPADPITARGVGRVPESYADGLDADALMGARIGILREPMGLRASPTRRISPGWTRCSPAPSRSSPPAARSSWTRSSSRIWSNCWLRGSTTGRRRTPRSANTSRGSTTRRFPRAKTRWPRRCSPRPAAACAHAGPPRRAPGRVSPFSRRGSG